MAFNIFISHVWDAQNDYYHGLIRLLDQAQRFGFRDLSVPKIRYLDGEEEAVKERILAVLRTADVVLVVNTSVVSRSSFVKDELTEAEKYGIPIIAVNPPRRQGSRNKSNYAAILRAQKADWSTRSIIDAIREAIKAKRRIDAASAKASAEATYEPVSVAIKNEEPFTHSELIEVRGDDEPTMPTEAPVSLPETLLPKDVIFKEKEGGILRATARNKWISKLFFRA